MLFYSCECLCERLFEFLQAIDVLLVPCSVNTAQDLSEAPPMRKSISLEPIRPGLCWPINVDFAIIFLLDLRM